MFFARIIFTPYDLFNDSVLFRPEIREYIELQYLKKNKIINFEMVFIKNLGTREANDEDFENIMNIDRNVYQGRGYLNGFEF